MAPLGIAFSINIYYNLDVLNNLEFCPNLEPFEHSAVFLENTNLFLYS